MKLLNKINRYFALYASLVFIFGGVGLFVILKGIIQEETSEVLRFERDRTLYQLENSQEPILYDSSMEKMIIPFYGPLQEETFKDTLILEIDSNQEPIPYRQLTSYHAIRGNHFALILRESLLGQQDLIYGIFISLILLLGAILVGLLLINFWLSKRMWLPFYQNLHQLKQFDIAKAQPVSPINSDIFEFQELNQITRAMTDKIIGDYQSLKEFTENASHEIQTPLAVIKNNLELMMNEINDEKTSRWVMNMDKAAQQVTRINQTLLLLAKIENRQFNDLQPVNISERLRDCLEHFLELAQARSLDLGVDIAPSTKTRSLNPTLIDILCNNLLSNAIRHNIADGWIRISLDANHLIIANSGLPLNQSPEKLFERFKKQNTSTESPGLGLSLVKKITDLYQWPLSYQFHHGEHIIKIQFD